MSKPGENYRPHPAKAPSTTYKFRQCPHVQPLNIPKLRRTLPSHSPNPHTLHTLITLISSDTDSNQPHITCSNLHLCPLSGMSSQPQPFHLTSLTSHPTHSYLILSTLNPPTNTFLHFPFLSFMPPQISN